jgi:hypothetical protein
MENNTNSIAFSYKSNTTKLDTTADLWTFRELKNVEKGPNESGSKGNSLFRGTPIKQDKPELSASFYAEQNPAEQAQPHPYQLFVFRDYQSPVTFDIKPDPVDKLSSHPNTGCSQQG